jgi:hypothetical protein
MPVLASASEVVDALTVSEAETVRPLLAPVRSTACSPGSKSAGTINETRTTPDGDAVNVPSVIGAEWRVAVTDSPGINPWPVAVSRPPCLIVLLDSSTTPDGPLGPRLPELAPGAEPDPEWEVEAVGEVLGPEAADVEPGRTETWYARRTHPSPVLVAVCTSVADVAKNPEPPPPLPSTPQSELLEAPPAPPP